MKKLVLFSALSGLMLTASAVTELITVSNVRMAQDSSSRLVKIKYDLAVENGTHALIRFDVLTNSPSGYLPLDRAIFKHITGDWSKTSADQISAGQDKTITWNAVKDWPGEKIRDVQVRITAYYTDELALGEWKYLRLDLGEKMESTSHYDYLLTDEPPVAAGEDASSDAVMERYAGRYLWFKTVPAGTFTMGAPSTAVWKSAKNPPHEVTLTQPFAVAIFPLTNYQYYRITANNYQARTDNGFKPAVNGSVNINALFGSSFNTDRTIASSSVMGKLRAKSGLNVTIPTEAQWEYACRAGAKGTFYTSDEIFSASQETEARTYYASVFDNSFPNGSKSLRREVLYTSARANNWDISDMLTNVAEVTLDNSGGDTLVDAEDPLNIIAGNSFILRGPWKWQTFVSCYSRSSLSVTAGYTNADDIGVRLVINLPE